jgi:hypothetical protein
VGVDFISQFGRRLASCARRIAAHNPKLEVLLRITLRIVPDFDGSRQLHIGVLLVFVVECLEQPSAEHPAAVGRPHRPVPLHLAKLGHGDTELARHLGRVPDRLRQRVNKETNDDQQK